MAKLVKGHPDGLMTLFFSEMWERFCYYGMRTLLTLYLVKSLMKGDSEASLIYGAYTGLVYAAPILGGRMADRFLGYRYAVILGAILMAIGEFLILGGNQTFLLLGMGALIIGNGYFKANISTIVGKLYADGDPRRDSGFTIFYIGINVGAFLATSVVAYVGETYGFEYGFGLAGIGMLLGFLIFYAGQASYGAASGLEITPEGAKKVLGPLKMVHLITIGSLLLIPLCYLLILNNEWLNLIFLGLFGYVAFSLIKGGVAADKEAGGRVWTDRMIALVIFILINVVFWAAFEQAGTSLTLFADRNVDREIFGWTMPASMTQVFNPLFIILFGSFFSWMWMRLTATGKNPSIPLKFSFGIVQLGLGFLIAYLGYQMASDNLVPLIFLVVLYLLHTTGELFLSPIGLSMVTKLSPRNMAGTAMGGWFLSFAIANLLGGQIAALTGEGHGGDEEIDRTVFTTATTVEEALGMAGRQTEFENWKPFYSLSEELVDQEGERPGNQAKKAIEVPTNLDYGTFLKISDWILIRESLEKGLTYGEWSQLRSATDTLNSAERWLEPSVFDDLKMRYAKLIESDVKAGYDDSFTTKDWYYFRSGLSDLKVNNSALLSDALAELKENVQSARLEKYINVFTWMGFVLIGFAILIALLSKPLNRLMHGVK